MLEVDHETELKEFEGDYEDYLHALGELRHEPIYGPRPGHTGENVFSYEWALLHATVRRENDPPNALLASILYDMERRITQRHASVAASFITWLGTNCGCAYIENAKRLHNASSRVVTSKGDAFIAAWSIENRRKMGVNRNTRIIESMLAPEDHFGKDLLSGMWGLRRMPNLSIEDHETIEHIAHWLGSDRASEFMKRCDHLIELRQRVGSPMDTIKIVCGVQK